MKKAQRIFVSILSLIMSLSLISCSSKGMEDNMGGYDDKEIYDGNYNGSPMENATNEYGEASPDSAMPSLDVDGDDNDNGITENPFVKVEDMDTSTFSADVDTASYTFLRKMINNGCSLSEIQRYARSNAIRTEELVNYFKYSYNSAPDGEMFGTKATIAKAPWSNETYLLTLGLKAKELEVKSENNLVFLIDVSGSMASDDKLPLLQQTFSYLVDQLDGNDTVSIVTYSGNESVVLDGAAGSKKEIILEAIGSLKARGSTNGEAGMTKAYEIAEKYFKEGGNNRIIIASDGDLNVGISNPKELEAFVAEKRESGVFLSVLGFGTGNFRDSNMSTIAQAGNGVYYYIDCAEEAERIFTDSLLSTIYTAAKDVKFQLTFDKNFVSEYRLIGYENRLLANEDFEDDTKDAGEVGAGHTLTVCYELKLSENFDTSADVEADGNTAQSYWIKLSIRYKEPDSDVSELREFYIGDDDFTSEPDEDFFFISSVIELSMLVRTSKYRNPETTLDTIIENLEGLTLDESKSEFLSLLRNVNELS